MKKTQIERPLRDPDHVSKRGVPYWFAPEWVRATSAAATSFQKVKALRERVCQENGRFTFKHNCKCDMTAHIYMVSKDGSLNYIQGSIQQEFHSWHDDRQINYILLGETPDSASELVVSETE